MAIQAPQLAPLPGSVGTARVATPARSLFGAGSVQAQPYAAPTAVTTNQQGGMSAGPTAMYTKDILGQPLTSDQRFNTTTGPAVQGPVAFASENYNRRDQRIQYRDPNTGAVTVAPGNPQTMQPTNPANGGAGMGTAAQGQTMPADLFTSLPPINDMLARPAALGQQFNQSGQQVQSHAQAQTNDLLARAQSGGITSQNVAAGGAPAPGGPTPPGGQSIFGGAPGGVQSTPGSFQVGQRLPTGPAPTAPGNVAGSSMLGGVRDVINAPGVANQLGGAPQVGGVGNVAGRLGSGPQIGNVGGVANQLGAAPQVGNVGNVSTGSAPGSVMPQLGNFGQQNAAQQGMLGRVESFLDAPQGPSIAEAQLQQSQANNMGALIGAARSGRGGAGSTAQALRGAMSEGSAIMSDTAGQLATLRAQEEDMRKNRDLSAIGLGGNLATAQRQQDLGFRGQDLSALQGDQGTALGARGQDLTANLANQQTQTALEGLRAQTALGARGQNLSALQGDQGTALGLEGLRAQTGVATRGQDLSALQGDQGTALGLEGLRASTALGARGQDLSALGMDAGNQLAAQQLGVQRDLGARGQNLAALQGDQSTQLGMSGLGVQRELGLRGQDVTTRAQDLSALTSDADRNLAAQGLGVQRELGLTNAGLTAQGQGLNYLANTNQQQTAAQALQNDLYNSRGNQLVTQNGQRLGYLGQVNSNQGPDFGEILLGNALQVGGTILGGVLGGPPGAVAGGMAGGMAKTGITQGGSSGVATDSNGYPYEISDERAKTDVTPLEAVKRAAESPIAQLHRDAKGYQYRYKPGFGEDEATVHWGPMAQDLSKSPVGRSLVKTLPTGLKVVDANRLTMTNHAAISEMRSELDGLRKILRAS